MNIIPQKKPIKRNFDYVGCLHQYDLLFKFRKKDSRDKLRLGSIRENVLKTLAKLEIDVTEMIKASEYECPFNGYIHVSLYPAFIYTDDIDFYLDKLHIDGWERGILLDREYIDSIDPVNESVQYLMGPGYTHTCYPSDGSSSLEFISVDLDNGDTLEFLVRTWYNI